MFCLFNRLIYILLSLREIRFFYIDKYFRTLDVCFDLHEHMCSSSCLLVCGIC